MGPADIVSGADRVSVHAATAIRFPIFADRDGGGPDTIVEGQVARRRIVTSPSRAGPPGPTRRPGWKIVNARNARPAADPRPEPLL